MQFFRVYHLSHAIVNDTCTTFYSHFLQSTPSLLFVPFLRPLSPGTIPSARCGAKVANKKRSGGRGEEGKTRMRYRSTKRYTGRDRRGRRKLAFSLVYVNATLLYLLSSKLRESFYTSALLARYFLNDN